LTATEFQLLRHFAAVAFSLIAALVAFRFLTLRLRRLAAAIEAFRASGFPDPIRLDTSDGNDGEIGRSIAAFQEMPQRILQYSEERYVLAMCISDDGPWGMESPDKPDRSPPRAGSACWDMATTNSGFA
jgi:hypothetical protein